MQGGARVQPPRRPHRHLPLRGGLDHLHHQPGPTWVSCVQVYWIYIENDLM